MRLINVARVVQKVQRTEVLKVEYNTVLHMVQIFGATSKAGIPSEGDRLEGVLRGNFFR